MISVKRFCLVCLMGILGAARLHAQLHDEPFLQAVSVKYTLDPSLAGTVLKKVVVDYNDLAYVLSTKGVLRTQGSTLVKDLRYSALAQKQPLDLCAQEGAGHLYYLFADKVLTNGYAGIPYFNLPANKYAMLVVNQSGDILLAGGKEAAIVRNGRLMSLKPPASTIRSVYSFKNIFYILSNDGISVQEGNSFRLLHASTQIRSIMFKGDVISIGTGNGYYGVSIPTGDTSFTLQTRLPVQNTLKLASIGNNVWGGTPKGVYAHQPQGGYRYYASRRWLTEDSVIDLSGDSRGNAFVLTSGGLNKIDFIQETLADKAAYFQDKIRQRHIRYGFISHVTLDVPGDFSSARMTDTDNDGLWSAFYLGSQAFRYQVTHDPSAKRYAWEAFEAFERLLSVNPLKGFPSRTFERKGFKVSDPDRWHPSQDPEWEWKGTTSSDEFVGYIFIAAVLNDMVAETESEKQRVASFMDKILMHIIDNNYYFIDADGKPTLWGRWNPEYINAFPETVGDRKLGSTTIIAGLQLGYALTGKELYKKEAFRLIDEHGYLRNMIVPYSRIAVTPTKHMGVTLGDGWNHSDDEMAFLTYWVLQRYAFNEELKKQYNGIITDHFEMEKPERNALWSLIAYGTSGDIDKPSMLWHLREFPLDLVSWTIRNSHRQDIEKLPPNIRDQSTKELLPPGEQPMHRHNSNAFHLDGGNGGKSELAGDEYLLPYWMARYLQVID